MRRLVVLFVLVLAAIPAFAQQQNQPAPTLKSVLLSLLNSTHDKSAWFVCVDGAVAGVTSEQASWTDGKGIIPWDSLRITCSSGTANNWQSLRARRLETQRQQRRNVQRF